MKKKIARPLLILLALILWTVFIGYGFIDGFLLRPITSQNTSEAFIAATKEKIDNSTVGNLAMVLIKDGIVSKSFYHSKDEPITDQSIFPVASISKWVSSFGILKLVEQGKIDLDQPIDDYLSRWQLPESEFDNKQVSIKRLLSHTSGLVDDLGYAGFDANEPIQTIEESLTKAADAPYSEGVARVGYEPGSQYMYSGAAYTILQLLIEEVSGQSFQRFMQEEVFKPLDMNNSTFVLSDRPDLQLVSIYKDDGTSRPAKKFTALAAASLMTCTADLTKFLLANISKNKVLSQATIAKMSEAKAYINNIGVYGLGPHLYSQNASDSKIIGHDGVGNNAINTAARIDLQSKNGIIILETGHHNLASSMADEWIFWEAGIADYVVMQRNKSYVLSLLAIGYITILISSFFLIRYLR